MSCIETTSTTTTTIKIQETTIRTTTMNNKHTNIEIWSNLLNSSSHHDQYKTLMIFPIESMGKKEKKESRKPEEQDIFCLLHLFDFWSALFFSSSSFSLSLSFCFFFINILAGCWCFGLVFFLFFLDWIRKRQVKVKYVFCLKLIRSLAPVIFIQFINGIKFSFKE